MLLLAKKFLSVDGTLKLCCAAICRASHIILPTAINLKYSSLCIRTFIGFGTIIPNHWH